MKKSFFSFVQRAMVLQSHAQIQSPERICQLWQSISHYHQVERLFQTAY
jgi:hypothetical protein